VVVTGGGVVDKLVIETMTTDIRRKPSDDLLHVNPVFFFVNGHVARPDDISV
jgi:hypothetical protein